MRGKLSKDQAYMARHLNITYAAAAARFGIAMSGVIKIRNGRYHKHIVPSEKLVATVCSENRLIDCNKRLKKPIYKFDF